MDLTRRGFFTTAGLAAGSAALFGMMDLTGCAAQNGGETEQTQETTEEASTDATSESVDNTVTYDKVDVQKATADEVKAVLTGSDTTTLLVDARPQEAYAGWALEGASRGGHLAGALLFSARWLDCDYKLETPRADLLKREMDAQNITSSSAVIVYDYTGEQATKTAQYLVSQGVKNCRVFQANGLIDGETALEQDDNYQYFVPSEIVKSVSDVKTGAATELSAEAKELFGDNLDALVIADIGWGNIHESSYLSVGHVPGAIHVNTDCYERPRVYVPEKRSDYAKEWRLISVEEFRDDVCPRYGITKDSTVIITGSSESPEARFAFMLRTLGVKVYVMSACLNAWNYNGYPLDTEADTLVVPTSVESFGTQEIAHPDEILWMDDILAILAGDAEGQVVDNRGEDEWKGEYSGYSYHDLSGHIDGTFWCEQADNFLNADGGVRTRPEYEKLLEDAGLDLTKIMAFFCGDSWGAAGISYLCQSTGLMNVKEWGNGWIPWSNMGYEFIDHQGRRVHYDRWQDTVVDENGNDARDGVNILDDAPAE
ncbi:MAG: rhodanese-like domain-containing protein [Atopobiaceae bacterium]|jgi:3-mercaptopyruvate sulfurtransferase SseA